MRKLTRTKTQEAKHLTLEAAAMASGGNSIRFDPLNPPGAYLIWSGGVGSGGGKSSSTTQAGANESMG